MIAALSRTKKLPEIDTLLGKGPAKKDISHKLKSAFMKYNARMKARNNG